MSTGLHTRRRHVSDREGLYRNDPKGRSSSSKIGIRLFRPSPVSSARSTYPWKGYPVSSQSAPSRPEGKRVAHSWLSKSSGLPVAPPLRRDLLHVSPRREAASGGTGLSRGRSSGREELGGGDGSSRHPQRPPLVTLVEVFDPVGKSNGA